MKPERGDLIQIFRIGYQHWAVYVGDGYVVHLVGPGGISKSSIPSTKSAGSVTGEIKKEKLSTVIGKDEWKVNNFYDKRWKPRPAEEIVKEALSWVGEDVKYSIDKWNCEHFATSCRYGRAGSIQAVLWRTVGGVVGGVVAIGGVVVEAPLVLAGGAAYLGVQLVKNVLTLAGISN